MTSSKAKKRRKKKKKTVEVSPRGSSEEKSEAPEKGQGTSMALEDVVPRNEDVPTESALQSLEGTIVVAKKKKKKLRMSHPDRVSFIYDHETP